MNFSKDQIVSKFNGIISAIEKMNSKERQETPTVEFVENYNKIRSIAIEKYPNLEELFPPKLDIFEDDMFKFATTKYMEILSYCFEIKELLENE